MNKSLITNLLAAACVGVGLSLAAPWREPVLSMGLFALAGAVTNWLAVHMLFEKVPGLYGSGVISARFEEFKLGIYALVMEEFFSEENLARFLDEMVADDPNHTLDLSDVIEDVDLSPAFDALLLTVKDSSFGSMLGMLGGEKVLEPLKTPFLKKLQESMIEIAHSDQFQDSLKQKMAKTSSSLEVHQQIEGVVQARLDELTAPMVKDIIQMMIREHLGWLVVWGGVFGGLIGLAASQLDWVLAQF